MSIASFFRSEWRMLLLITLTGIIYNVGLLAGPWYEGQMAQCLTNIIGGSASAESMIRLVGAYVTVTLTVQGSRFLKRLYVRRFGNNINRSMKHILYANLIRKSKAVLEDAGEGELLTRAISDVDDCAEGIRKFTTEIFDTGVALLGYVFMLFAYDWRLTLLSLLFMPASYICAAMMKKTVQQSGAAYKKAAGRLNSETMDRAQNAVTYRIYGCEAARESRYREALAVYGKAAVRSSILQTALAPLYLAVSGIGVVFILWLGAENVSGAGWRVWDIAAFTTFLSCFSKLSTKSSKVAKLFNSVQKAQVSWMRIKSLMKKPDEPEPLEISPACDVEIERLSLSYTDEPIFAGLTISAKPGDIIGVTGAVACGKSTFGKVFLGEMKYKGSVRIGRRELSEMSERDIAGTVGYLGHDPELSSDTVKNNILCGEEFDAEKYLEAVSLRNEVMAMENGMDMLIGTGGIRLSGGQAQRLALARTLAHQRPVLILDDPFSALDRKTEDAVFEALRGYAGDKVVFLISHRLYHFPEMQRVIFIEDKKVMTGSHEELLRSAPGYRRLYEAQNADAGGEINEQK